MMYNSLIFFVFLIPIIFIYYLLKGKYQNYFLLFVNFLLYSYLDVRFSILLISLTSVTYFLGELIRKNNSFNVKRNFLIIGVFINVCVLAYFKYLNFFIESIIQFASYFNINLSFTTLNIILPVGLSFYIFQTLTYLFDIYYENLQEKYSYIEYLIFASFFPTVVAGPIERAARLLPQIRQVKYFNKSVIAEGFALITVGLVRKVIIADSSGLIVNHIMADPQYFTSFEIFIAILLFNIQVYNDFAGYSNISRGIGIMLGYDIMTNFKQPYFATSVADFWRKWHISLSTWLRDYLFKPLQIKYRNLGTYGNALAILITFLICGLWHGASWNFIIWGLLHGLFMSFAIIFDKQKQIFREVFSNTRILKFFQILITISLVTFANIFFRTINLEHFILVFNQLYSFTIGEFSIRFLKILFGYVIFSCIIDYFEIKFNSDSFLIKLPKPIRYAFILSSLSIIIMYILISEKLPFLYGKF